MLIRVLTDQNLKQNMKNRTKLQNEIIDSLPARPHGILDLSIRMGKTRIATTLVKRDDVQKILWVTPSTVLRDKDIPDEVVKWWNKTALRNRFDIICWSSLKNITNPGHYDTIVLDEIQYITEGNAEHLLKMTTNTNIIGLTGTMPKHQEKKDIFRLLDLKVLKSVHIDEAVDMNLVADYTVTVHEIDPDGKTKNIEKEKHLMKDGKKQYDSDGKPIKEKFYTTEAANLNYLTREVQKAMFGKQKNQIGFRARNRMFAIYNSPTKLKLAEKLLEELEGRKLVFAGSIAHAEHLSPNTYHSKTDNTDLEAFKNGEINELALVNAGGVGHTYKDVEHFIIVQANSNKRGDVTQKIGRALLSQGKKYKAQIHIIVLRGTKDEDWAQKALEDFDEDKIKYKRHRQ